MQLPAPAVSEVIVQLSPVVALTCTLPVGVPLPVTDTLIVTACPVTEGFGVFEVMVVVVVAFSAVVEALAYGAGA